MKMLSLAVIVSAVAFGNYLSAQDKPRYTAEAMRERVRRPTVPEIQRCVLPDNTQRAVNTSVTFDGKSYRCVVMLDQNFLPLGVAWTPVDPQP